MTNINAPLLCPRIDFSRLGDMESPRFSSIKLLTLSVAMSTADTILQQQSFREEKIIEQLTQHSYQ